MNEKGAIPSWSPTTPTKAAAKKPTTAKKTAAKTTTPAKTAAKKTAAKTPKTTATNPYATTATGDFTYLPDQARTEEQNKASELAEKSYGVEKTPDPNETIPDLIDNGLITQVAEKDKPPINPEAAVSQTSSGIKELMKRTLNTTGLSREELIDRLLIGAYSEGALPSRDQLLSG